MKRYGVEWKSDGGGDWYGSSGRFSISIWMFGPRHQCKEESKAESKTIGFGS